MNVSAEMPSSAQQSGIGIPSINAGFGGFATAGGAVRITPAGVEGEGAAGVNLTVAFIGVSGVGAIRAVSFRGASGPGRFSIGDTSPTGLIGEGGRPGGGGFAEGGGGFSGEDGGPGAAGLALDGGGGMGGLNVEGGAGTGPGGLAAARCVGRDSNDFRDEEDAGNGAEGFAGERAGGSGGLSVNGGDGGPFASIFGGSERCGEIVGLPVGPTAFEETDAGGRTIGGVGGRRTGAPLGGSTGFGATNGGGGETRGGRGEPEGVAGVGGRAGKLIRVVSFATGTVGRWVGRGGRVIRTVSFFGSFRSAISL